MPGPGGRGGRYLAPIGTSQFRFLFTSRTPRKTAAVMRDSSIAWASCSRKVNDPTKPAFVLVTSRTMGSGGGVATFTPIKYMQFDKPCSEDKTNKFPKTGATFGNPALPINRR